MDRIIKKTIIRTINYIKKNFYCKQFFNFLFVEQLIEINPATNITAPKKKQTLPRFLGEEDIKNFKLFIR